MAFQKQTEFVSVVVRNWLSLTGSHCAERHLPWRSKVWKVDMVRTSNLRMEGGREAYSSTLLSEPTSTQLPFRLQEMTLTRPTFDVV